MWTIEINSRISLLIHAESKLNDEDFVNFEVSSMDIPSPRIKKGSSQLGQIIMGTQLFQRSQDTFIHWISNPEEFERRCTEDEN